MKTKGNGTLLEIRDLQVRFRTMRGTVQAVNGVSLRIERNEIVGLIGESGAGKSVTGRSILRLLTGVPGIVRGSIWFEGSDLLKISSSHLNQIQGLDISMISQDPLSSLNPVFTIGEQMTDAIIWSKLSGKRGATASLVNRLTRSGRARFKAAMQEAEEFLSNVGLPSPRQQLRQYPHQLSGGMRQRVLIAMSLVSRPKLLIADEPTTALDVTVQAQILNLVAELARSQAMAVLYISHDLSVVAQLCDTVAVMYAGRIIEQASALRLFQKPMHPYTKGLLGVVSEHKAGALPEIPGEIADMISPPPGCAFHPRCSRAQDRCPQFVPPLEELTEDHVVACPPALAETMPGHAGWDTVLGERAGFSLDD